MSRLRTVGIAAFSLAAASVDAGSVNLSPERWVTSSSGTGPVEFTCVPPACTQPVILVVGTGAMPAGQAPCLDECLPEFDRQFGETLKGGDVSYRVGTPFRVIARDPYAAVATDLVGDDGGRPMGRTSGFVFGTRESARIDAYSEDATAASEAFLEAMRALRLD